MWQQVSSKQRHQLAIVLGLSLLYGCVLGSQFYVPRLVNILGGNATIAGLLVALSLIPVFLVALFGRRIAQRWTPRQVLRMGLASHALQLLLLALAPNLLTLIPSMLLGGFGYGFSFAKLLNSATELTPKTHYAQGIAYFTLVVQMGIGLGSLFAAMVEPVLGTHGIFWVPLALSIVSLVLAGWLPMGAPQVTPSAAAPRARQHGNILEMALLMGVLGLTFGLPLQFVPMWLGQSPEMHFSPAYFLTTSFFTIMTTRILFGHWLSGKREFRVVVFCFAVVAAAIAVLGTANTPMQFVACAFVYGATYSLLYPSCIAYLMKQVGADERSAWSNWVLLGYEVGARCLPAGFGIIADQWGFPVMFRVLALLIASAGVWHVIKRLQQDAPAALLAN